MTSGRAKVDESRSLGGLAGSIARKVALELAAGGYLSTPQLPVDGRAEWVAADRRRRGHWQRHEGHALWYRNLMLHLNRFRNHGSLFRLHGSEMHPVSTGQVAQFAE